MRRCVFHRRRDNRQEEENCDRLHIFPDQYVRMQYDNLQYDERKDSGNPLLEVIFQTKEVKTIL